MRSSLDIRDADAFISAAAKGGSFLLAKAAALAIALVVVVLVFGSYFTIDQGKVGIVLRNGKAVEQVDPGLHFKAPLIDDVKTLSTQTLKRELPNQNAYSKDIQAGDVKLTVNYHLAGDKVMAVFSQYGTSYASAILDPKIAQGFKETFGKMTAADIVSKRDKLAESTKSTVVELLKDTGIIVDSVQIEDIKFSTEFERAIEKAMKANAEFQEAEYNAKRDEAKAKGLALAEKARAEGISAVAVAEAGAIKLKGDAIRQNPGVAELMAIDKWDGRLPENFIPGQSVPFVNVPQK